MFTVRRQCGKPHPQKSRLHKDGAVQGIAGNSHAKKFKLHKDGAVQGIRTTKSSNCTRTGQFRELVFRKVEHANGQEVLKLCLHKRIMAIGL